MNRTLFAIVFVVFASTAYACSALNAWLGSQGICFHRDGAALSTPAGLPSNHWNSGLFADWSQVSEEIGFKLWAQAEPGRQHQWLVNRTEGEFENGFATWQHTGDSFDLWQVVDFIGLGQQYVYVQQVDTATGNVTNQAIFRLTLWKPGDANLDLIVDFADYLILSQNYGLTSGVDWREGDFDQDGDVDFSDYLILAQNYGT